MEGRMFSDGEMVRLGWNKMKENLVQLILVAVVMGLIVILTNVVGGAIGNALNSNLVSLLFSLASIVLAIIMGAGFMKIMLKVVDGGKAEVGDLFKATDVATSYLFVTILYGLIVVAGTILFVIPGIIWSLKYSMAPWLVVDKKMAPMDALKKSAELTNGIKWDLLGFMYVLGAVNMLGVMALYIGMIVTAPTVGLAQAGLYRHLSK